MSTSMDAPLLERVKELSDLRAGQAALAATLKGLRDTFDFDYADLIGLVREQAAMVAAAETALRAVAIERYDVTKNRKPAPGVEVRLFKSYEIDESAGLAWAKEKGLCLIPARLDVAAIKKLATVQALPFVLIDEEPRVMIASDLGLALASWQGDVP